MVKCFIWYRLHWIKWDYSALAEVCTLSAFLVLSVYFPCNASSLSPFSPSVFAFTHSFIHIDYVVLSCFNFSVNCLKLSSWASSVKALFLKVLYISQSYCVGMCPAPCRPHWGLMTFDIVSSLHVCVPLSASIVSSVLPLCYLTCCSTSSVPRLVVSVCEYSLCLPCTPCQFDVCV